MSDYTVVITGVSGQLGTVYAEAFLSCGASVVGLDIGEPQNLSEVESEYEDRFRFLKVDITDKPQIVDACEAILEFFDTPTVLINNAAIDSPPFAPADETGPFEQYPEESWDRVHDVNLKGTFFCCQVFGGEMAAKGRGSIINISSIYGAVSPDQSLYEYRRNRGELFFKPVAYSSSKAAILNLTRYLATYWAHTGLRVNTFTPAGVFNHQDEEFLQKYCERIPIKRMARASEYVGPLLFLASDASSYMTGSNLIVDGGWTAI